MDQLRRLWDKLSWPQRLWMIAAALAVGGSLAALDLVEGSTALRDRLMENARTFRDELAGCGFEVKEGIHPIVPVMLGDARLAADFARDLFDEGVYAVGFSYPVVPRGEARIRVQLSAAHSPDDLKRAVTAFATVGKRRGVLR